MVLAFLLHLIKVVRGKCKVKIEIVCDCKPDVLMISCFLPAIIWLTFDLNQIEKASIRTVRFTCAFHIQSFDDDSKVDCYMSGGTRCASGSIGHRQIDNDANKPTNIYLPEQTGNMLMTTDVTLRSDMNLKILIFMKNYLPTLDDIQVVFFFASFEYLN
ncbi:hypothetical protein T11_2054 [Trichinella zimbabwensis]|uniref:ZP domain-containing protein n=1 Tax=Trichinella zimbabwensis TaxID=268475 RepID=A0A0V1HRH5_9BILA|nr:hypothetical protein T11_2054 [Trichinella zimbabwensis]